jgi:hypothetical protein
MDATETTDLELSAIWEAMESAGATVYEWCEDGVTTGVQAIRIGRHHWLTVSDSEGYEITAAKDVPEDDLIPAEEAFEITYRDGSRVYFRPKQVGRGFEPRIS